MSNFAKYENLQALFTAIGKKKLSVSDTMPTAGAAYEDICILYIGPTDANYTKGYVYECEEVTPSTDPKTYAWNAKINVDVDLSKYKTIFPGTKDEWDALTEAQQDQYDYCFFDDDESDYFAVVDSIIEGNMHPVTSNATYGLKQTVEQNSDAIADIVNVYGSKNLLSFDLAKAKAINTIGTWNGNVYTRYGVSFTPILDDKGHLLYVNVDGTNSSSTASAGFFFALQDNRPFYLPSGNYKLTGCPSGGSNASYNCYVKNGNTYENDTGNGKEFTVSADNVALAFCIAVEKSATVSNIKFYPMIRRASVEDNTYAPYAKTNKQLTEDTETINITDSVTTTVGTLSVTKGYRVGKIVFVEGNITLTSDVAAWGKILTVDIDKKIANQYIFTVGYDYNNSTFVPLQLGYDNENLKLETIKALTSGILLKFAFNAVLE